MKSLLWRNWRSVGERAVRILIVQRKQHMFYKTLEYTCMCILSTHVCVLKIHIWEV